MRNGIRHKKLNEKKKKGGNNREIVFLQECLTLISLLEFFRVNFRSIIDVFMWKIHTWEENQEPEIGWGDKREKGFDKRRC